MRFRQVCVDQVTINTAIPDGAHREGGDAFRNVFGRALIALAYGLLHWQDDFRVKILLQFPEMLVQRFAKLALHQVADHGQGLFLHDFCLMFSHLLTDHILNQLFDAEGLLLCASGQSLFHLLINPDVELFFHITLSLLRVSYWSSSLLGSLCTGLWIILGKACFPMISA